MLEQNEPSKIERAVDKKEDSNDGYLKIHSKISELSFDTERIDNYTGAYARPFLQNNFLRSLNEIKILASDDRPMFELSMAKAVGMFLDSAKLNLVKPMNELNKLGIYNAIIALKIFRSLEIFEGEYLRKIKKLK